MQGLIQNSASRLKLHLGEINGAQHLNQEAYRRIQFVLNSGKCDQDGNFMGVDIEQLLQAMEKYDGPAPHLSLHE